MLAFHHRCPRGEQERRVEPLAQPGDPVRGVVTSAAGGWGWGRRTCRTTRERSRRQKLSPQLGPSFSPWFRGKSQEHVVTEETVSTPAQTEEETP